MTYYNQKQRKTLPFLKYTLLNALLISVFPVLCVTVYRTGIAVPYLFQFDAGSVNKHCKLCPYSIHISGWELRFPANPIHHSLLRCDGHGFASAGVSKLQQADSKIGTGNQKYIRTMEEWILCPVCRSKTRIRIRDDNADKLSPVLSEIQIYTARSCRFLLLETAELLLFQCFKKHPGS